jgi:SAM-dependent methyltransferase
MSSFKNPRESWNARYANAEGLLFGSAPNAWLAAQQASVASGMRVLCPADGDGRNSVWLASLGAQVTAFDLSDIGVEHAIAHAKSSGLVERVGADAVSTGFPGFRTMFDAASGGSLTLCCAHIGDWPWADTPVDLIAAIFFQFADPALRACIFDGFQTALKPGGLLIIEGYGPRQLVYKTGGPGVAENLYTLDLLRASFSGWPVLASRDCDAELHEGNAHAGQSHLISMVLRKPD